jgi:hypothetical protein
MFPPIHRGAAFFYLYFIFLIFPNHSGKRGVSYPFYRGHLIPEFNASGDGTSQTFDVNFDRDARDILPRPETLRLLSG